MTYVSPTPERAFQELEILVEINELEAAQDERQLCTAFRSRDFYSLAYDDWMKAGFPAVDRAYGAIPARIHAHLGHCLGCQEKYLSFLQTYRPEFFTHPTQAERKVGQRVLQALAKKVKELEKDGPEPPV